MNGAPRRAALFTPEQDDVLRENYIARGQEWCARRLDRTVLQVRGRAWKLGLCRAHAGKPPPVRYDAEGAAALLTGWRIAPGALDRDEALTA